MILSSALQSSGAVDRFAEKIIPKTAGPVIQIAGITFTGAVLSAFMNNVGALALLMPIAIRIAVKQKLPPGRVLMPLAFGSILGGMTTLIGTPPNLIVSGFRAEIHESGGFGMFDFTPVGIAVAVVGVLFIVIIGWRLVPSRERPNDEGFETGTYFTEVKVTSESKAAGKTLFEIEKLLEEAGAQVVALIRREMRLTAPNRRRRIFSGDILVVEVEPESLSTAFSGLGLSLEEDLRAQEKEVEENNGDKKAKKTVAKKASKESVAEKAQDEEEEKDNKSGKDAEETLLAEMVVMPGSRLIGRSAADIRLRTRYGVNLVALSRHGQRSVSRLRTTAFRAGDVLLMQGSPEALAECTSEIGCVPLAERSIQVPDKRHAPIAIGIMAAAVAGAAFGLLPAAISFAAGVLASLAFRIVQPRTLYDAVDWPVIVLLGALIPVAGAMATTGAADLIAVFMMENVARGNPMLALALVLIVTMTLSDFMNNAATAAVMCPIAIGVAEQLGANSDPFLMAVAIGASCAFLTPIGHQNNTLILGPGGFRFGDYWKLGLPMEILVIAISIPALSYFWPM